MRCSSKIILLFVCTILSLPARSQNSNAVNAHINGVPVLDSEALNRKIVSVRPTAEEDRYRQVPWRTNLADALKEAQTQKKPLFIWAMDGNPLCWT